jgi:membrane protease YdiL (CAAX protease family)
MVLAVAAGAVEEILYRGYAIEKLAAMTGHRWVGAVIATIVFALVHIPTWGWAFALTADLLAGAVLAIAYLWRRDLVANILAHSGGIVIAMLAI